MANRDRVALRNWAAVGILLLAFGLRIYRLGEESLWYDETVSVHLAGKGIPALVAHTAGDIHPPGYYLLLHAWTRLAGDSDFAVAFLSLFFGVLLVALAYRLAARVFGPTAGLLAALLVAVSPFNLWYSQEVRMYTLAAALGAGVLAAVISLLDAPPEEPPFWAWLAVYTICGALGLWTLYYFAFLLVAVNLVVGVWWLIAWRQGRAGWNWLGRWLLAQGAVLLLYAPWLSVAWRQATDPPVPPWRDFTPLGPLLLETWTALSLGQSVEPARVWPLLILFVLLFALGLLYRTSKARGVRWLLAVFVFVPVLLIYLASFFTPLYHVRYVFTYALPFYIIVGAGLAWLGQRWRPALGIGLALILLFSAGSIYAYHTDPRYASDDHRAATRFLAERWRPGDAILVNAGYAYPALLTYWDAAAFPGGTPIAWRGRLVDDYAGAAQGGPLVLQTGTIDGDPSLGWGDPDSDFYAVSQPQAEEALARLFADFDRVWVYRIYDTVTDPGGAIRHWLDEHGTPSENQVFTGESQLRVQAYLTGRDPLDGPGQALDAALADGSLRLVAASWPPEVEAGGVLDLALVWQVESPPGGEAILFAGLFDEEGRRWAQADERPLGALYSPERWPEGATVRTPLRVPVPPGTPPGRYRLEVGWYRFVDGQPVWLPWTSGEHLALGEVAVESPEDWSALPLPTPALPLDVTVGEDLRLLGLDAPSLEGHPGDTLEFDLVWQALEDAPEPGFTMLQLTDGAGNVLTETSSAPVGGRVPFAGLAAGQSLRDPHSLALSSDLAPGVYDLSLGRQRPDGTWLPVQRGPFPLGSTYPLATVRVTGRPLELAPPLVQQRLDARFGSAIRLFGYDLRPPASDPQSPVPNDLYLTLHWQALEPMDTRYKLFLHLVGEGGPADIRAQTDVYPHLPTTAWVAGEYLSDDVVLDLPADLPPGLYSLLLGLYDEETGERLPVFDTAGETLGDSLPLQQIRVGE